MPTRRGGRQAPRGGAGGPGGRQRDGGLPLRPRLAWAPGSPFVMVVTAEKAGPKVVSILVWRENECDSALTPRRMWTHTWMWADTIPLRSPHARTLADTPTTHTAQPTRGTSRDGLRVPESPPGPWARGGHRACPEATLPSGVPHPGGVWGGKVARPPGEAVVAGALARAHALERHPGSSGGVPCRQSTNMGLQTAAQALLVGEAAPPGGAGLLWKAWLHHQLQQA